MWSFCQGFIVVKKLLCNSVQATCKEKRLLFEMEEEFIAITIVYDGFALTTQLNKHCDNGGDMHIHN